MAQPWRRAGIEPRIPDMLLDPIVQLLVTSDHVFDADISTSFGRCNAASEREAVRPEPVDADHSRGSLRAKISAGCR